MLTLEFKPQEYVINKDTIGKFELLGNARQVRSDKVTKLARSLLSRRHFDAPIVVNQNGKMRVIDGQHRILAIKKALKEDEDFSVKVLVIRYDNKDSNEEIDLFKKWNIGVKQSTDDFINMYQEFIPILKKINKDFPCKVSIYRKKDEMHFKLLCGAYISAKRNKIGGYTETNDKFVQDVIALEDLDYIFLKSYIQQYITELGKPSSTNLYYNTTPFSALIYVYMKRGIPDRINFWKKIKLGVAQDRNFISVSEMGGVSAVKACVAIIEDHLDR